MSLTRAAARQMAKMLAPLQRRVTNMVARGVVSLINDGTGRQTVQVTVLGESLADDAEHFQPYGFSSVPPAGSDAVVLFVGGNREHPLVLAAEKRTDRPTGAEAGEVMLYHPNGQRTRFLNNGDVEVMAAPGGKVFINDGSGGQELATLKDVQNVRVDLDLHEHMYIPYPGGVAGAPVPTTGGPAVTAPTGTTVVFGK